MVKKVKLSQEAIEKAIADAQAEANRVALQDVFRKRIIKMVAEAKKAGYQLRFYSNEEISIWPI